MATSSQTYYSNSLAPTSTLISGSSTPTDDPNSGESISDLFSISSSPPLIVAFLVIGLFVLALIGIFGWRRLSRPHRLDHQFIIPNRRRDQSISLGKRPTLWDEWVDLKVLERSSVEATRWENIAPVTAIMTLLIPRPTDKPPPPTKCVDPGGHTVFRTLKRLAVAVKRFYVPAPPPAPPPPAERDEEVISPVSHASEEIEWGDVSSLQVSIVVAMPTQRRCSSGTSGKDAGRERMALGEFCIGMMEVPWCEDG